MGRMVLVVRVGMGLLAVVNAWWGGWARFAPRQFFDTFPGFGQHHWTAAYPPYNEHLVTDLGSTFLTLAFLLAVGALLDHPTVRWVVLAGVLVFNGLHLEFHTLHCAGSRPVWPSARIGSPVGYHADPHPVGVRPPGLHPVGAAGSRLYLVDSRSDDNDGTFDSVHVIDLADP